MLCPPPCRNLLCFLQICLFQHIAQTATGMDPLFCLIPEQRAVRAAERLCSTDFFFRPEILLICHHSFPFLFLFCLITARTAGSLFSFYSADHSARIEKAMKNWAA